MNFKSKFALISILYFTVACSGSKSSNGFVTPESGDSLADGSPCGAIMAKEMNQVIAATKNPATVAEPTSVPSGDLTAWYDTVVNSQNAKMQAMTDKIVLQNMSNPKVQSMFRSECASGKATSFRDFSYMYAATGGFSQQGIQNYNQTSQSIAAQQQAAMAAYRNAQANRGDAQNQMNNNFSNNQNEFGNVLTGNMTYTNTSGSPVVLPYISNPGYYTISGQNYFIDNNHQYYQVDMASGLMNPIFPKTN